MPMLFDKIPSISKQQSKECGKRKCFLHIGIRTGVERNGEIRFINVILRKITFYLGGKIT